MNNIIRAKFQVSLIEQVPIYVFKGETKIQEKVTLNAVGADIDENKKIP